MDGSTVELVVSVVIIVYLLFDVTAVVRFVDCVTATGASRWQLCKVFFKQYLFGFLTNPLVTPNCLHCKNFDSYN